MSLASGSIDLKSLKVAGERASKYISADSSGIMVYNGTNGVQTPSNPSSITNNVFIDDNSLDIRRGTITLATFSSDETVIGISDGTQGYVVIDYHSLKMKNKEGDDSFYVFDVRDAEGKITEKFVGDGTETVFTVSCHVVGDPYNNSVVKINGVEISDTNNWHWTGFKSVVFNTAPSNGDVILITYKMDAAKSPFITVSYTLGKRAADAGVGVGSIAQGYNVEASGLHSQAYGIDCAAYGEYSYASGQESTAKDNFAHASGAFCNAQGQCSIAIGNYCYTRNVCAIAMGQGSGARGFVSCAIGKQNTAYGAYSFVTGYNNIGYNRSETIIGEYCYSPNDGDHTTKGDYALIIGNGTNEYNLSNALTVDWNGNITIPNSSAYKSKNSSGDERRLCYITNANNNIYGYDSYNNNEGGSYLYGNTIGIYSKGNINIGRAADSNTININGTVSGSLNITGQYQRHGNTYIITDNIPITSSTSIPGTSSSSDSYKSITSTVANTKKDGYTLIGVTGYNIQNADSGGANSSHVMCYGYYIDSSANTVTIKVRNLASSTAVVKINARCLYRAN